MADTWITDMRHYLDVWDINADVPGPAARLAHYLGTMAESVTASPPAPGEMKATPIPCRRRPGNRPCPGRIVLRLQEQPQGIRWHCPACGDNGLSYGYEDTPWNLTPNREGRPDPGPRLTVLLNENEYRAIDKISWFDPEQAAIVKGAWLTPRGVEVAGPAKEIEFLLDELASYLNHDGRFGTKEFWSQIYQKFEATLREWEASCKVVDLRGYRRRGGR